jgi:hypothetical protein
MKKYEFKVSTGITSILMIFVVLCLTAFGVLSYSAANVDLKLSQKNADSISSYYSAESAVNEKICEIDGIILKARQDGLSGEAYYEAVKTAINEKYGENTYNESDNTVTITENIGNGRILYAALKISEEDGTEGYTLTDYFVRTE